MAKDKKKKPLSTRDTAELHNAARTLFANIMFTSPDNPIRSLVMTSSVPNEGKTTTIYELAKAIGNSGAKVLLVEADMRRRSLANHIGVHPEFGLYALLTNRVPLSKAITQTSTPNLYFLDVEPNLPNPADVLSSNSFRKLVDALQGGFDYVLFDSPPVGTFIDAAILSSLVDAVVMAVRVQSTKRQELLEAYDQLKRADANVIGACATFVEYSKSDYYYQYYEEDSGKRVDSSDVRHVAIDSGSKDASRSQVSGRISSGRQTPPGSSRGKDSSSGKDADSKSSSDSAPLRQQGSGRISGGGSKGSAQGSQSGSNKAGNQGSAGGHSAGASSASSMKPLVSRNNPRGRHGQGAHK